MSSVNSTRSFIRNSHIVGVNEFHFEFCPKYRYECMKREYINKEIEKLIRQAAKEHNIIIKEMAVGFDHVHIDGGIPFDMSPAQALGLIKGRSAYLIFRRFPNFRLRYPKGHFWSKGNFARSISGITSGTVDNYIENQQFDKLQETIREAQEELKQLNLLDFC